MDFKKLFSTDYLFDTSPPTNFQWSTELYIIFAIIIAISVITIILSPILLNKQIQRFHKSFLQKTSITYLSLSIVSILLIFSRLQNINFFSMRFLLLTTIFLMIGLTLYFIYELLKEIPPFQKTLTQNLKKQKYLPHKKKKKK